MWLDGQPVHRRLGPGGRQLAAFLCAHLGITYRREKLCGLFWGELSQSRAQHAMNTAVWRIRTILSRDTEPEVQNLLHTEAGEVCLYPSEHFQIDSRQLDDCVRRLWLQCSGPTTSLNDPQRDALRTALEQYNGPFLEDFDNEWVLEARERLEALYIRGLMLLSANHERENELEEALNCVRRVLIVDPFRETVQRNAMRLYVRNGQQGEAIRLYERSRKLLREEFGIDPMPQSVRLYEQIANGTIFADPNHARKAAGDLPDPI